jgi:hypothetical protein
MVTKPKLKRGLGVINLRRQNEALLLKNLHKFFNKEDLPWLKLLWSQYYANGQVPDQTKRGSFWWRSNMKLLTVYKGIAQAEAGIGDSILFWHDMWNECVPKLTYPHLFSFTTMENIILSSVLQHDNLYQIFRLPLSEEAFEQYCDFQTIPQSVDDNGNSDQ